MADPYQTTARARAYSGSNSHLQRPPPPPPPPPPASSYSRGTRPNQILTRTPSYDDGDDVEYFDGGTGVGRRQSVQTPHQQAPGDEYYYDQYYDQQNPQRDRRASASMGDQQHTQSQGYYAGTNNGGSAYRAPYSPGYPASSQQYDSSPDPGAAPYPTTTGYNGTPQSPPTPGHTPYNPAAYQPTRHATNAGYTQTTATRPQRHATTGGYNPGAYSSAAPYPTNAGYSASSRPLAMPVAVSSPSSSSSSSVVPHPAQAPFVGYSQYPGRPQYATSSYVSASGQYSPSLPSVASAPPANSYRPPPPPPPPIPPTSPSYNQTPYDGGGSTSTYGSVPPYPDAVSPGQTTLSHSSSQRTYMSRPETFIDSASGSEISTPEPENEPHQPLPSPPKERPLPSRETHNYANSQPLPSPPPPAPPSHGRSRSHSRPLPRVPGQEDGDALFASVEGALAHMGSGVHGQAPEMQESHDGYTESGGRRPLNGTNGHGSYDYDYNYYGNDEVPAGGDVQRHKHATDGPLHDTQTPENEPDDDDLDYGMDLGMGLPGFYGGSFSGTGASANANPLPSPPLAQPAKYDSLDRTPSTNSISQPLPPAVGQDGLPSDCAMHPFPEHYSSARVDTWGTGGLASPSQVQQNMRRLSFDEGDEEIHRSRTPSPTKRDDSDDDFPELFYHPPPSTSTTSTANRPLPSPPAYNEYIPELRPAGTYSDPATQQQRMTARPQSGYPPASPTTYAAQANLHAQGPYIPRAISMSSHSSSPVAVAPVRSKTDSRTYQMRANRNSALMSSGVESDTSSSLAASDLPAIPLVRKFDPKKLSSRDFKKCAYPWALSSISAWLKEITEGEQDLREATVADAVTALFTHTVPTMNVADAETLAAKVVSGMMREKNLVKEEEWVKFGEGTVCGVIYQITGNGCYSPKLHELDAPGRCYSHHCARTLKKIALPNYGDGLQQKMEDWASFWKIKKDDVTEVSKKEIERQNNLHEIVQTEEEYVEQLRVLATVYRDQIKNTVPPILKPSRVETFVREVFGGADAVRQVSEEHLLPQLKFRQREQGPWVVGFSDIFREWIRKAKAAYLDYAGAFPKADMLVRRELDRNMIFKQFLEAARQDPRTRRLDWVTFLKGPITRLQRYSLLLSTVLKHTIIETEEKHNLERAIEEIKAVTLDCDARVDEMSKRVQLIELSQKLMMRDWKVGLRLEEIGRELIFQGDLMRTGNTRYTWLETHCILLDHYLILAKRSMHKEGSLKHERYDVSKMPIPMDLLVLESTNDDPVVRGTASKLGISGPAATAKVDNRGRHNTMNGPPGVQHTNSSSSVTSAATAPGRLVTTLPDQSGKEDKLLYPFRIKHLGGPRAHINKSEDNTYILYASTAQARKDWCDKILMAKEKHAASLHAQNAEPFRLRIIADAAFAYDGNMSAGPKPIRIRGTPLDRAIADLEKLGPRPNPICRAQVNCATAFTAQYSRQMVAIGTDFGVFISDVGNPRDWRKAISAQKVTQIQVLEEFSLFLVLADKTLVAHHLDSVVPPASQPNPATKAKAPQRLHGGKDVGFFATGRMKDRLLVFYKRRDGITSIFKVVEPVFQKSTEKKSRFSRKGTTEFFRDFEDFYIPTDTYGINLFHSSLAIQTAKGFEVMTLDKKQPWSVPELKSNNSVQAVTAIAQSIANQKPLGMFRLSDIEFLLCYEECAVYVNKHGDVSRSVIMEFVGKARAVALYSPFLLVFDQDFVEIRNADNGRLRQVIAGRDVRCIDDAMYTVGGSGPTMAPPSLGSGPTVKVAMAHPEFDGRQLVVELVLNEGQRD